MPVYSVFGGTLHSELAFAGLPLSLTDAATWSFRVSDRTVLQEVATVLGRERVSDELEITLSRLEGGSVVLTYSAYDLGAFQISPDGSEIVWHPGPDPWMDPLRWILMGRVMATAMYLGETLCLHGSAVSLSGQGICFLAPKFHGKSTLAGALLAAGARLASDDVVPIDPGPPVLMRPGVPVLRLRSDSESAVSLSDRGYDRADDDVGKARIDLAPTDDHVSSPLPLAAVYILEPLLSEPEPGCAAVRTPADGISAFELLSRHTSIAPLLAPAESRLLMSRVAAIVRSVPIYRLRSIRDLERLPEVVDSLLDWHGCSVYASDQP